MALQVTPGAPFALYVLAFAGAAVACFTSAARARRVEDPGTLRGLVALLLTSGVWASAHVGYLAAPTVPAKTAFYSAGLVAGIAAVGAWLYFCSAYTGRSLHRNRTARRAAVGLFLAIVLLKLTNPIHGLYFTTELVATPFPHLAVDHGLFHWLAMGLAYALAVVGYFMLFELFTQVGANTRPLAALAAVTGLPVLLDVIGLVSPALVDVTYEPLGVAVFSVVTLFVYLERFQAIRLAGSTDEPVVVVSEEDRIRDFNRSAADLFPELQGRDAVGEPFDAVLPSVADAVASSDSILAVDDDGDTWYYRVTVSPFSSGRTRLGRLLTVSDVTERERYRRELVRQNERLEQFASMVSHDLRNPLNVAMAHVREERTDRDGDGLRRASDALDRMAVLIEDLLALARTGQPIDEVEPVSMSSVASRAFGLVETADAELVVGDDLVFSADPERLQQLFENLVRNAIEHGRPDVTIRVGALDGAGIFVEDDGPGIPEEEREDVLESG